ncbi:hypothetical protein G3O08_01700 [Cryomorpha ignava]|uniref:DUF2231 domain-containing protein n=1 Tax=Cryomorpha ignava TaxID=101383 RepID=A0A7K3WKP3_9FLAO|nr:hypothetical protein [Cryomorpha ignava]NEN22217.1 hypothetical protein [Cryomorpha ignava]
MNAAEIHLAINHLPIAATLFGLLILIGGMLVKSGMVRKTGLVLLIAAGLFTIPTVLTGENAEDIIENVVPDEGIHDIIHEHEEMAESARWVSLGVSLLAILAFYFTHAKKAPARLFTIITLIAATGSMVYLGNVASTGGEIRHTETRDGFVVPAENSDGEH